MSRFATAAQGASAALMASNETAHDPRRRYVWADTSSRGGGNTFLPGVLWSGPRFCGGGGGMGLAQDDFAAAPFAVNLRNTGGQQAKILTGTTRDSAGAVLGSCIVQGFLTAGDVCVGETTSDTAGWFSLPTPYTGAHYLVAYKAAGPDIAGTTLNTLVPV